MNRSLLRSHLWFPLLAFLAAFGLLEILVLDPVIARAWSFDPLTLQWRGAGSGAWWARGVLHTGGRWLVRGIAAAALLAWLSSFVFARARAIRLPAGFVALAIVLCVTLVGGLKTLTNVDCPWDLIGFGGHQPYVLLFADRPDYLPSARCFPGAHSSAGFALVCFYFVLRDPHPRAARWALGIALATGIAFSIGQEARGAHFLSHDLTSAALVWFMQLALYRWLLWPRTPPPAARAACSSATHPPAAT